MPKLLLHILALTVVILTAFFTMVFNWGSIKPVPKPQSETAINQAKNLYDQRKKAGEDFSSGPCLSNALLPGWVLDLVHSPREKIDDSPENQCPAYLEGGAEHFVELDLEGNLVRAK